MAKWIVIEAVAFFVAINSVIWIVSTKPCNFLWGNTALVILLAFGAVTFMVFTRAAF